MKHTLADPTKEWEGFRPTAYRLDPTKVWHLALTRVEHTSEGQRQTIALKLGEVLTGLMDRKILKVVSIPPTKVTTDAGELFFDGPSFSRDVLEALLDLRRDGINGNEAFWFWYDRDRATDQLQDRYGFFVVHKDKIVRDQVTFVDYDSSGFDPSVFTAGEESPQFWLHENKWEEAHAGFWYRKFYQEARMGQLMVLREDAPELHHYPEARWRPDLAWSLLYHQMRSIHIALWIMLLLIMLLGGILLWRW